MQMIQESIYGSVVLRTLESKVLGPSLGAVMAGRLEPLEACGTAVAPIDGRNPAGVGRCYSTCDPPGGACARSLVAVNPSGQSSRTCGGSDYDLVYLATAGT